MALSFGNDLLRFVETGCKLNAFTKKLYQRLCNCFRHIAHYDRCGFFETWFASDEQILVAHFSVLLRRSRGPQLTSCGVDCFAVGIEKPARPLAPGASESSTVVCSRSTF